MQIGASIHASDLTLPEGTTLAVDPETLILHVLAAPTAEQLEADLGETEGAETPEPAGETDAEPAEGNEG
jgi:large subunit ribosomal protein L25